MIKRIFILCTLLLATAYLILAVTTFNSKPADPSSIAAIKSVAAISYFSFLVQII